MQTFYENIPDELRVLKRWGLFELKFDPSRNKNTKIPVNAMTGDNAKTNDPSTWCDFKTAKEGLEKIDRASGLAFFFGDGYVGVKIIFSDGSTDYIFSSDRKMKMKYDGIRANGTLCIVSKGSIISSDKEKILK